MRGAWPGAVLVLGALVAASESPDPNHHTAGVIADNRGGFPAGLLGPGDSFGNAIGRIGDINNDTITDFVVGAPLDDYAGNNAGAVYVLQMTTQTTVGSAFKITEGLRGFAGGLEDFDQFGSSADGIGDVDGNGVEDIAVGTPNDDDVTYDTGAVYVMLMAANVQVSATVKITTGQGGFGHTLRFADRFGGGLAGMGDIDGNGVPDIAVGAFGDDTGGSGAGAVYVLLMLATGRVSSSTKIANALGGLSSTSLANYGYFGSRVAGLGDVNGDGVPDIAVGAPYAVRGGKSGAGSVYILHLAPDGTVSRYHEITTHASGFDRSLEEGEDFSTPCRVGDVDGDGIDDLAVGAWGSNSVYVLLMDGDGSVRDYHRIAGVGTGRFGFSVSFVERASGVSLLVGAPFSGTAGQVHALELVTPFRSTSTTPSPSPLTTTTAAPSADSGTNSVPLWVVLAAISAGFACLFVGNWCKWSTFQAPRATQTSSGGKVNSRQDCALAIK